MEKNKYCYQLIQEQHNNAHGIIPKSIQKEVHDITESINKGSKENQDNTLVKQLNHEDLVTLMKDLDTQMKQAAKNWEFEKAAQIRDEIIDLRKLTDIEKIVTGVDQLGIGLYLKVFRVLTQKPRMTSNLRSEQNNR